MGGPGTPDGPVVLSEVASVTLPTSLGVFDARAFEGGFGRVYLALTKGDVAGGEDVLARVHSECLTGDALGSLRCDCGIQLRRALRAITAAGRGVLVYATGHEGRGIGLIDKLRSYVEQDRGADTVDANLALGVPVDARHYGHSAAVLAVLDVRSVRLLTNNPAKVERSARRWDAASPRLSPSPSPPTPATSVTCGPRSAGWGTSVRPARPSAYWWTTSRRWM